MWRWSPAQGMCDGILFVAATKIHKNHLNLQTRFFHTQGGFPLVHY